VHILVVEDNVADARLVEEAIRDQQSFHQLSFVTDGRAAMAFVRQQEPYAGVRRTDLILLDLNLPHKDGREVLAECKADPALRHIPVIIWTSTQADAEVRRLYELGAAAYCVKPFDLDDYLSLIRMIVEFWGQRARLAVG
jgi:two-component system, chemotaxis family, response regulator Rcp1